MNSMRERVRSGLTVSAMGIGINVVLAVIKIVTGVVGNSYALIADGIESTADIVSSMVVWSGMRISAGPADDDHPYGHGKAESLAGLVVALALVGAAILIVVQSVDEIRTPHHAPAWFTLPVLLLVIVTKEALSRLAIKTADRITSTALRGDGWHHRSDALTSAAAFVGISIALVGGQGFESADDWAALLACGVIGFNGLRLVKLAAGELMDAAPTRELATAVKAEVRAIPGVLDVEKCWIRKYGVGYIVDIHVVVDGSISVRQGHAIAHQAKDALLKSSLHVVEAMIHIEPGL